MQQAEKPKTIVVAVDFGQLSEDDPCRVTAQRQLGGVRAVLAAAPVRWDATALDALIAEVSDIEIPHPSILVGVAGSMALGTSL